MSGVSPTIQVVGFIKLPENENGIPSADYLDYMKSAHYDSTALMEDLQAGHLPPGLIIWTGKKFGVVVGRYETRQRFVGLKVLRSMEKDTTTCDGKCCDKARVSIVFGRKQVWYMPPEWKGKKADIKPAVCPFCKGELVKP
jgi:hypothetical protein